MPPMHYASGEEIRAGDRILWEGKPGKVWFVVGQPGMPVEWVAPKDWLGEGAGFMIDVVGFGLFFYEEPAEEIEFVGRAE